MSASLQSSCTLLCPGLRSHIFLGVRTIHSCLNFGGSRNPFSSVSYKKQCSYFIMFFSLDGTHCSRLRHFFVFGDQRSPADEAGCLDAFRGRIRCFRVSGGLPHVNTLIGETSVYFFIFSGVHGSALCFSQPHLRIISCATLRRSFRVPPIRI